MKSLISRESHRRDERYSGVYHIQGGMVTDADLDERSRITQDRIDNLGDDSIMDGVPGEGGAVAIAEDGSLFLREGVIYADGVRGDLRAKVDADLTEPLALFSEQADFPKKNPELPKNGDLVIYADIWERPVFPLEDPYLADVGLHGAVTAFRTRTMTQLKAAPLTDDVLKQIETGTVNFPRIGTAILGVKPRNVNTIVDECDPCAEVVSAEQIVPNELWRLEVIDVEGTPEAPGTITLAWSIENAAAIAPRDVDPAVFKRGNKVYEFYSENTESNLGVFANAADAERSAFVDDLDAAPEAWPFVRRWDGRAVIDTSGIIDPITMGGGTITLERKTIKLKVDAFDATLNLDGAAIVAGDYWLVELRRFALEAEDRVHLVQDKPVGVEHHYCVLFRVNDQGGIMPPTDAEIRKLSFPVLSNLPATHVGFDNMCGKLYANAENVQEALDNLCDISADDVAFTSTCEIFGNSGNVQAALDALCKIDFSVHASFRLMFDWGVLCGLVPSLVKPGTGMVNISAGAFLDRSGRVTRFEDGAGDLSKLKLGREILFDSAEELQKALKLDEVCLALAADEGGKVSVFVVPRGLAFGPDDPGFRESAQKCLGDKTIINIEDLLAKLSPTLRIVAGKILLSLSGDGAFEGSAKLTETEAKLAAEFNAVLFTEYEKFASQEEIDVYRLRLEKAEQDNPLGNSRGAARQVRQMQYATAVFTVFTQSDDERMRRCLCEALFPTCPPELGKEPYFVPIACLRGDFEVQGGFFLEDVCPFCCRKQAMTSRALQHFIGESRDDVAKQLSLACCGQKEEKAGVVIPDLKYNPDFYETLEFVEMWQRFKGFNPFNGSGSKPPLGDPINILVNDLSEVEATKTLTGNGLDVTQIIDIDDEKAFEFIVSKSVGVSNTQRLIAGQSVRPGDKVGLLLQDGVARGYVLLEFGSGKLPYSTAAAGAGVVISEEDKVKATELFAAIEIAKTELTDLAGLRETLSADVDKLEVDVQALNEQREKIIASAAETEIQLGELADSRIKIAEAIEAANKELAAAEVNRKTIVTTLRRNQPVTVVAGNQKPELLVRLAGAGFTTVADISKLTDARIRTLSTAGVFTLAEGRKLKRDANTFLERPLG